VARCKSLTRITPANVPNAPIIYDETARVDIFFAQRDIHSARVAGTVRYYTPFVGLEPYSSPFDDDSRKISSMEEKLSFFLNFIMASMHDISCPVALLIASLMTFLSSILALVGEEYIPSDIVGKLIGSQLGVPLNE